MKKFLMKGMGLLAATVTLVSCSHDAWNQKNSNALDKHGIRQTP